MDTQIIRVADLPASIVDSVCDHISLFTVGMDRIDREKNGYHSQLIGTGTLVILNGLHCILTADHVLSDTALRGAHQLGLLTSFTGRIQRYALDLQYLGIHTIERGPEDCKGPDIGLIVLPDTHISRLKNEKVFFNIDKRRKRFTDGFIAKEMGIWFTCGTIEETETDMGPHPGFGAVKGYQALCGRSGVSKEYPEAEFDYLEMTVDYETGSPDLPHTFAGCSGGGVWQVLLRKNAQGEVMAEDYILSGVVFYQTGKANKQRVLRCHGRQTIYMKVPELVASKKVS
jgi:hypothetical protein